MMTGRLSIRLLCAALMFAGALCSCTILEDRVGCPMYTTVNVDMFIEAGKTKGNVLYSSSDGLFNDPIVFKPYQGIGYEISVPRSEVMCAVVGGNTSSSRFSRDVVYTAEKSEADPLFAYTTTFKKVQDLYTVNAVPHKQYCKVTFSHIARDLSAPYPYVYRITCKYNGLNLSDMQAVPGDYVYVAEAGSDGVFIVNVPRQGSYDMLFEILALKGDDKWEAEPVHSKDLTDDIRRSGFDWDAEDLGDLEITVDFTSMNSTVMVREWDKDYTYSETVL